MALNYQLIAFSFLFGGLFIVLLRKYDIHEREPFYKMSLVTLWGGIWSIVISTLLYGVTFLAGLREIRTSFGVLFVVGPVEESAKLLALFSSYFIIRKELNEPTDGLIYMSCVALGFSLIENYFYATKTPDSNYLVISRLLICTPAHILFSVLMGLAFYAFTRMESGIKVLALPFLYASALHGLYDLIVFNGLFLIVVLVLLKVSHSLTLSFLSYTTAKSPFRKSLTDFITSYEKPLSEEGLECINCGSKNRKTSYRLGNIYIQKCDQCPCYVTTRDSLYYIFHHFGSTFKNLSSLYSTGNQSKEHLCTLYRGNYVSDEKKMGYFFLDKLNDALEELNQSVIEKMEKRWWFIKSQTHL